MSDVVVTAENGTQAIVSTTPPVQFIVSGALQGPPGTGLPLGGVDGQFISRDSTTASGTRWVTITKSTVDLGNVDNTSDLNKPISTATQAALDTKADISFAIAMAIALG